MITALPEVAQNAGATRILRGHALTSPVGNPHLEKTAEKAFRKNLVWRALQVLTRKVEDQLVVD
jgi:betaine reductase